MTIDFSLNRTAYIRAARMLALAGTLGIALGICAAAIAAPAIVPTPAAGVDAAPALSLANTAVYELDAAGTHRRYPVWIDVPDSYASGDKALPVVFVTDATYSFPLVRSIRNLLGQHGRNIEDFILVGLPPEQGLSSKASRSRDYTPSNPRADGPVDADDYSAEHYGEAAAYRDFIEQQVFALVAANYRADMHRKVFAGHSLGGLFGSFVLLTKPSMFQTYILSSPSLWFDRHEILKYEERYAAGHKELAANVMIYAGGYETVRPGPRYFKHVDLAGDMRDFVKRLKARNYPGLSIDSHVIDDEDHLTVFPSTISRGLVRALPGAGPYTSG